MTSRQSRPGRPFGERRTGSAILLVLAAAALLTFVTVGALAAAAELTRQAAAEGAVLNAELAAEAALARRVAGWDAREPARAVAAGWLDDPLGPAGLRSRTHLQPAGPALWRLDAAAELRAPDGAVLARRARTLFLRARPPAIPLDAPLTAAGALHLGPGARLVATAEPPAGWACTPQHAAAAPLALLPGATASGNVPAPVLDAGDAVVPALLAALDLAAPAGERHARPTLALGSLTSPLLEGAPAGAGGCPLATPDEPAPPLLWGDPARPSACAGYFPYVHVRGDLVAPVGAGQGILVVDGDLTLTGGFHWAGLIVVRGALRTSGSAMHIHGAVALLGAGPHELEGDVVMHWSPCAVAEAARASARVTPVTGSAWSALH